MEVGDVRKVTVAGACTMGLDLALSLGNPSDSGCPEPPIDGSLRSLLDHGSRDPRDLIHARV